MAMKQLTLKVKNVAFYNGALVLPNEIIRDYKGSKIPSWATLLNGDEVKKDDISEKPTPEKTEAELMKEYNALLDEAVEKEILLEDADKKTIAEQIVELKKLLGKE